jgi:hypothetical protein
VVSVLPQPASATRDSSMAAAIRMERNFFIFTDNLTFYFAAGPQWNTPHYRRGMTKTQPLSRENIQKTTPQLRLRRLFHGNIHFL